MEGERQKPGSNSRYRRSHSTVESPSRPEGDSRDGERISQQRPGHRRSYSFDATSRRARANENDSSSESEEGTLAGVALPDRP